MATLSHDIKWIIIITVLILILAVFWHFLYALTDNDKIIGYIAPVNSSLWEQLKTYVFPIVISFLIVYIFNMRVVTKSGKSIGGNIFLALAAAIQVALVVVIVIYYTYTGALTGPGNRNLLIDIMTYIIAAFLAAVVGWFILTRVKYDKKITYTVVELQSLIGVITPIIFFAFLTYTPGPLPISKPI